MTRNARALTLAELVIALAVTSVVATAVAGVTMALSTAQAHAERYGQSTQCAYFALMQITRRIRASALVPSSDAATVVLWTGDSDGNGAINYDEIAVISYDPVAKEVRHSRVVIPEQQKSALNTKFGLRELTSAQNVQLLVQGSFFTQTSVLATDVTAASFSVSPSPPLSRLVSVRLTVGAGNAAVTVDGAAALRSDRTQDIVESNGIYYLGT
jgi:hypothetical protein